MHGIRTCKAQLLHFHQGLPYVIHGKWEEKHILSTCSLDNCRYDILMVSCEKGPTRHAYAWQIGPFWQDTIDLENSLHFSRDDSLVPHGWGLGAFLRWWPPSTMWFSPLIYLWPPPGMSNNSFFSNFGLCAACWVCFMCRHELWLTSVSHPFSSLISSLGFARGKHYQKITIPIFRLVLQNFTIPGCFLYILFCRYLFSLLSSGWFVIAVCGSISVQGTS